jgi:hypothetical protein
MAKIIPNQKSWVGWTTASLSGSGSTLTATAAQVAAATNVTPSLISVNASATGNTVPTPSLDSLFETSVSGTVQAQFSMDLYRDDSSTVVWDLFARGNSGYVIISRYGGGGASYMPIASNKCEIWPVQVTARTPNAMTSNTVQTFTVACAVWKEPNEWATVAA